MFEVLLSIMALIACGFVLEVFAASFSSLRSGKKRAFRLEIDPLQTNEDFRAGNPS